MKSSIRRTGQSELRSCVKVKVDVPDIPYILMIIIMYIYRALINALSARMLHINIFYTHVEHSPTKTIYIKYYIKHTHTHTHTQLVQIFLSCESVEILLVLIFSVDVQHYLKQKGGKWLASFYHLQSVLMYMWYLKYTIVPQCCPYVFFIKIYTCHDAILSVKIYTSAVTLLYPYF